MTWDEKEGRPISTEEAYLDDVLDQAGSYTWLDMSGMEKPQANSLERPEQGGAKGTGERIEFDLGSLSTFGTRGPEDQQETPTQATTPTTPGDKASDDMSLTSFQSRVSTLEESVTNVQGTVSALSARMDRNFALLLQAQGIKVTPDASTNPEEAGGVPSPTDASLTAGGSQKPPADRV